MSESHPVVFGYAAEGFLAAKVGDSTYAMLPTRAGHHIFASGLSTHQPVEALSREDFFSYAGTIIDETAFRSAVQARRQHFIELEQLGRRGERPSLSTPWGSSQWTTIYADGVQKHSCAGHGGFELSPERNRHVPQVLHNPAGYYEEDCEWAAVATAFPDLFTALERADAERCIRAFDHEAWKAIYGQVHREEAICPCS